MENLEAQNMAIFVTAHADKVLALMQVGFFDMKCGSVTCHFGDDGRIRKIERNNVFSVT